MQAQRTFIYDPESVMPESHQRRHFDLLTAAGECYDHRNATEDAETAQFFHETGDIYFMRAMAILEEWE